MWPHFVTAPDLFGGTSRREARKISSLCTEKWFPQGTRIFSEGDSSDSLCILKKGLVKLISLMDNGRETILHILKPNDVFGELLLSEGKRAFTAVAIEDVLVTTISRESFLRILSTAPRVALNFIRVLSKRLCHSRNGAG